MDASLIVALNALVCLFLEVCCFDSPAIRLVVAVLLAIGGQAVVIAPLLYGCVRGTCRCVFQHMAAGAAGFHAWLWGLTAPGRRDCLIRLDEPTADNVALRHGGLAHRSWTLVSETAALCRIQLGLDRTSDPSDQATRALVKKTVWGIFSDKAHYPDLRMADAVVLATHAAELALTPTQDELESLQVLSSAPYARNRSLARGAWGVMPTTWYGWFCSLFGARAGREYLPPVRSPSL